MYDLKVINAVLDQLEEERGIAKNTMLEAVEMALATAYKKEYGKKGQIIRASFNPESGDVEFYQVKIVVDPDSVVETKEEKEEEGNEEKVVYNSEHHILLDDALKIKSDAQPEDELTFPLEVQQDFGRIASQTAKQVIMQKIREAEKTSVLGEFGEREGEIVTGSVQRIERGNIFVDLGRATGLLPREEQIPGERFRQGERVRGLLLKVDEGAKGVFLKLSRSHPKFLQKLFEVETPELSSGTVMVKSIAREAGSRTKIAVAAESDDIDPVGALVGQRGVRVSTVMSELGGEKIDIIEWSEDAAQFIEDALSPAKVLEVEIDEEKGTASVEVAEDQQSLAIGKGGQNVRLAAKLTGWRIDIQSSEGEAIAEAGSEGDVEIHEPEITPAEDLGAAVQSATMESSEASPSDSEESEGGEEAEADSSSEALSEGGEEKEEKEDEATSETENGEDAAESDTAETTEGDATETEETEETQEQDSDTQETGEKAEEESEEEK